MDGADDVELDDGAPVDAFVAEGGGGVEALEFWGLRECGVFF